MRVYCPVYQNETRFVLNVFRFYFSDLRRGDAIAVEVSSPPSSAAGSSTGHYHFGIYVGGKNQEVIDYVHTSGVRRISLTILTERGKRPLSRVQYKHAPSSYPPATVAERAEQVEKKGFGNYDRYKSNCEHFVTYCMFGERKTLVTSPSDAKSTSDEIIKPCNLTASSPGATSLLPGWLQ